MGANPNEFGAADKPTPLFHALRLSNYWGVNGRFKVNDTLEYNFNVILTMSWTLIESGADPRILNIKNYDAFQLFYKKIVSLDFCEPERKKILLEKLNQFKARAFEYIKISGLDQKPAPELPQKSIEDYYSSFPRPLSRQYSHKTDQPYSF